MGWDICEEESMEKASELILRTCALNGVDPEGLVLHSDNGRPDEGLDHAGDAAAAWNRAVLQPSARERRQRVLRGAVPDAEVPPRLPANGFDSMTAAIEWVENFVAWYNGEHRHSGIKFVTPDERHFGREQNILKARVAVYERARAARPERWSRATRDWSPEGPVRLNPPARPARTPTASEAESGLIQIMRQLC